MLAFGMCFNGRRRTSYLRFLCLGAASSLLAIPSLAGPPVSDDFSSGELNTSLWTLTNPLGSSLAMSGTQALLSVPAGSSHDPWTTNNSVRIMQPVSDVNFEVEAKF